MLGPKARNTIEKNQYLWKSHYFTPQYKWPELEGRNGTIHWILKQSYFIVNRTIFTKATDSKLLNGYKILLHHRLIFKSVNIRRGFPGGPVVKNSPAKAGDTGLIPGPRGPHMPRSQLSPSPQLLSQCSKGREPQLKPAP